MLYQGDLTTKKTDILAEEYVKLLDKNIKSENILVLLQNSSRKNYFTEKVLKNVKADTLGKLRIHSFYGLVYNAILDSWAKIENNIPDKKNTTILPYLTGLELSQYIMKKEIPLIEFKGYNSGKSLLHQLFRRYSLIVQNHLSAKEVKWRSEKVLNEAFSKDAEALLELFKKDTLNYRTFDYLRQTLIFDFVYKKTEYFKNIEYLFVDDGDEVTPVVLDFIKYLVPNLKQVYIAYDEQGATRVGYLSAEKNAASEFKKILKETPIMLKPCGKMHKDAQTLYTNVIENKTERVSEFCLSSFLTRQQMLDLTEVKNLLRKGVKPSDITIITPVQDSVLKFCIKNNLYGLCNPVFISGSEKLSQNPVVAFCIEILKLADDVSVYENFTLHRIFNFLQIPLRYCDKIFEKFAQENILQPFEFEVDEYTQKYNTFLDVLKEIKNETLLSKQVYIIYQKLIKSNPIVDSNNFIKLNFLIKQIEDFEVINADKYDIINQLENSIIADNPSDSPVIMENDLIVATPQKIIDNQIVSKYQFWLDISSNEWRKNDTGPLYNAWVMQKTWEKDNYTLEDNIILEKQKTARILRKLVLSAKEKIFAYSSFYDGAGIENFGGIEDFIVVKDVEKKIVEAKPFIPREDQKPVLEYKKGEMAISAVPGAGKTTILLELVLRLLKMGTEPEKIFVMTYMDSAARNFRERIKKAAPNLVHLPNISTIHGLALRILKENSNFERVGLNSDFDICDDSKKSQIISAIISRLKISSSEAELFSQNISVAKMADIQDFPDVQDKKISKFISFYSEYQSILRENNLIDYDDMLLLSVKILRENKDVLEYYQNICEYIIEDEAQDSSAVQQELIKLLSSKSGNIIRCGDVNQSITTTFSNADVEGFKKFIMEAKKSVTMNSSQRCTEKVWKLANKLVLQEENKTAFLKILMKPVEDKNPVEKNALSTFICSDNFSEKNYVIQQIKLIFKKNPNATIGVLLRNNSQVGFWTSFIENSGIKTIARSESLGQKRFFKTIFGVLKIISNPFNNDNLADVYELLSEQGFYKKGYREFIKNFKKPFIQANLDDLEKPDILVFLWDMIYWLNFATISFDELIIKIGLYYYNSSLDKSNIYILSAFVKRLNIKNLDSLISRLNDLSKKSKISGIKFFNEEEESDIASGRVQVMTIHKSKGDEFDYVFLPEMSQDALVIDEKYFVDKKNTTDFTETIKSFSKYYKVKTKKERERLLIDENLRVLYVAITRAKRKLIVSTNSKKKSEPNKIFDLINSP